jgi:hypothetical protein
VPKALAFEKQILDRLGPEAEDLHAALRQLETIFKIR